MEVKEVIAIDYNVGPCDDIGFLFFVNYICPHCGKKTHYSGLEGFKNEYDDTILKKAWAKCEFCNGRALVFPPDPDNV